MEELHGKTMGNGDLCAGPSGLRPSAEIVDPPSPAEIVENTIVSVPPDDIGNKSGIFIELRDGKIFAIWSRNILDSEGKPINLSIANTLDILFKTGSAILNSFKRT